LRVVDRATFSVAKGEVLALVGESSSGKSLIAMGAIDLLSPGARVVGGTTTFEGQVLQDLDDTDWGRLVGMGIGVMLQDAIGAWDPIDPFGPQSGEVLEEHGGLTEEEISRRVMDALGEVGLNKKRTFSAYAHVVSRGQAQRAMLAAALITAPRLLIADEPLSGLDVTTARAVLTLIDDLRRARGMSMILVTHDLATVASVADRVAVIYGGRIVEQGLVDDIFSSPQHPYTEGLLGSIPGLSLERLRPIRGEAPDLVEAQKWGCAFAPRCDYALDSCFRDRPPDVVIGSTTTTCALAGELVLRGVAD
ncbi:ABC transporter ATP-binding protein, partial [bacterium]|nr:ABC transporter ATP-binding protein [bacterium]